MSYISAWHLTMRQGPQPGKVYPLSETVVTIGRSSDNTLTIDDPRVSRHHVRLTRQQDGLIVEDLNSANGTWINNMKIATPVRAQSGDFINLGPEIQLELVTSSHEEQETIMAAPGQMIPVAPVYSPSPATPAASDNNNWLTMGVIGALGIIIIVLLLAAGGLLLYRGQAAFSASVATATSTATLAIAAATEAPTYTPYPTYTTVPTEPPTATPYPTYTPVPTEPPTATPYPTYTPFPTQQPTATPYPTYTPAPAQVVVVQPTQPPATPTSPPPTPTSPPPYVITLGNNVHYEPWGNPADPEGCKGPYDDRIEVRRFYAQVLLTNNSTRYIGEDWYPSFISASGAGLPSCVFYYNNLAVEPGETIDVTYGTHLKVGDYVKALVFEIQGYTEAICLNPGGQKIPCQ
jgi:hypothetical protein